MDIRARCLRLPAIAATVIFVLTTAPGAVASELLHTTSRLGDAENEPTRNHRDARISLSHTFGSDQTPFWLHSNRDGLIPLNSRSNLLLSGEYHAVLLGSTERVENTERAERAGRTGRAGAGLDGGLGPGREAGRDTGPDAGFLQNAGLRLDGGFRLDARISDGENRFGFGELYLQVRPADGWRLTAGIVHNLMWGGTHPELGRLHGSFRSWLNDVFAQPDREVFGNVTPFGNGLGAYEFGVEHRGRSWSAGAYRMFYIEDGESLHLPNT